MDTELFQHPLSLKHELNLQWRDPVGRLKIPPRDTDPRSPDEVGSFVLPGLLVGQQLLAGLR